MGIAGGSASGKSTLAETLAQTFETKCLHIRLDDFYRDLAHLPVAKREQQDFDIPTAIDWATLFNAVRSLRDWNPARIPEYCFSSHTRKRKFRVLDAKPLVFIEGLWAFYSPALHSVFQKTIFVDCPIETRLERRLARDSKERGRSKESIRETFLQRVIKPEETWVAPQLESADHVVNSPVLPSHIDEITCEITSLVRAR